MYITNNTTYSS